MVRATMIQAVFLKSIVDLRDVPEGDKPHIALIGRSNVGKSSLINHLTQQKSLAHVSTTPGRTRTINIYNVNKRFYLVDLPGYGFAKTAKDRQDGFSVMIKDYLENAKHLALVILIIDANLGPTDLDMQMLAYIQSLDLPMLMIANKIDKLSKLEEKALLDTLVSPYPDIPILPHSTQSGKYRGQIWEAIERAVRSA